VNWGADAAPLWSTGAPVPEEVEPLPSMFRRPVTVPVAAAAGSNPTDRPANIPASHNWTPASLAAIFFSLAAVGGAVYTKATHHTALQPAVVPAPLSASPPATAPQPSPVAPQQLSLAGGAKWSKTVDTFQQLVAQQKLSPATTQQAENERLLRNLDAWMKAKAR
jgi:hypothetical protein